MITFSATVRSDADGTLSLAIPAGLPNAEVDVVVVIETNRRNETVLPGGWPEEYFEGLFGSVRDAGMERPEQGQLQERLGVD